MEDYAIEIDHVTIRFNMASEKVDNLKEYVIKLIKKELINSPLAKQMSNISVGTVHTFQGAERRIILFSTVYGSGENCYFIDKDESMMNVAVSRAKDAFIVFGDRGCFSERETSATYLLGHTCEEL